MLGENAVRRSAAPISSAMEWNRFLKTSSSTGSRRMRRSVPESSRWSLVVGRCREPQVTRQRDISVADIRAASDDRATWFRQNSFLSCKFVLTVRSYCRNILCYGSCSYYKLSGFCKSGPVGAKSCKGKSFTEDSSRWQPRRKQKRRNTNRLRNVTSHGPRI